MPRPRRRWTLRSSASTGSPRTAGTSTYGAYADVHGETLPARLTLERDAVRVRLVVDDWQL